MADQNRRGVELANNALIMVDDSRESKTFEWGWILANLFNLSFEPGPRWREDIVARFLIAVDPAFPASRCQPESVNQNDSWLARGVPVGGHGFSFRNNVLAVEHVREYAIADLFFMMIVSLSMRFRLIVAAR